MEDCHLALKSVQMSKSFAALCELGPFLLVDVADSIKSVGSNLKSYTPQSRNLMVASELIYKFLPGLCFRALKRASYSFKPPH